MQDNRYNKIAQDLNVAVEKDYNKLSETGKSAYLEIRKKKIRNSYVLLISLFSVVSLSLFISAFFVAKELFIISAIALVLTIVSIIALICELKQSDEKMIKAEIKRRLMPQYTNNIINVLQNKNYVSNEFVSDKTLKLATESWSMQYLLIDNSNKQFVHKTG